MDLIGLGFAVADSDFCFLDFVAEVAVSRGADGRLFGASAGATAGWGATCDDRRGMAAVETGLLCSEFFSWIRTADARFLSDEGTDERGACGVRYRT